MPKLIVKICQTKRVQIFYQFAFLLLLTWSRSALIISSEDLFEYYNLSNESMEYKFNFSKGNWYEFSYSNPAFDKRLFEFHPNVSGFVHANNEAVSDAQVFLNRRQSVLIFYKDKKPRFGFPLAKTLEAQERLSLIHI